MSLPPPPVDLLRDAALFLDFDGTLVELAPEPDAVRVDTRLARLLLRLDEALAGRVAIVSGRSVATIDALVGERTLTVAGSHGLELRWTDGRRHAAERPAALDRIMNEMKAFASDRPGVLVEEKPLGAALHYRTVPAAEAASHALARRLATETGLHLQTGKMMVELRGADADKGTALALLMAEAPMAGHRPVFLGDDDTDEPAMATAARLGGAGILVGPPRDSAAHWRLPDVAATLDWLERAAA